jgi:hypothetical protein
VNVTCTASTPLALSLKTESRYTSPVNVSPPFRVLGWLGFDELWMIVCGISARLGSFTDDKKVTEYEDEVSCNIDGKGIRS